MLLEIGIRNVALVEKLRIEFGRGLNVLTGETGAGKSIVVDALNLALGGRADRELIRSGSDRAAAEALFEVSQNAELANLLGELGLEAEDGMLSVGRELNLSGRNICRVAGSIVPLTTLRRVSALLVDLHGQHEHQQLLSPARHLSFLDRYGDEAHEEALRGARALYAAYRDVRRAEEKLTTDASERERLRDILRYEIEEIDAVKPKDGEEEKLSRKNSLLRNAEKISQNAQKAYALVYAGSGRSISAQDALRRASEALSEIAPLDERFESLRARLEELFYAVQDAGYELQDVVEGLNFDPGEADRISERLSALEKLCRKYGPEIKDVLRFREEAAQKLNGIEHADEAISRAREKRETAEKAYLEAAEALSALRRALAKQFSERLVRELNDLGMKRTRFEVRLERLSGAGYTQDGVDAAEFLISPNPGEPLKPLSSVASGGEIARVMLALKAMEADRGGVDAMVFDEIDTGVSGRMAQVMGEKMASIARKRQVICVTHLPQIAAMGNCHFLVEKVTDGERTGSRVLRLDEEGRIREIARLVGGAGDEKSSMDHARNMFRAAQALIQTED